MRQERGKPLLKRNINRLQSWNSSDVMFHSASLKGRPAFANKGAMLCKATLLRGMNKPEPFIFAA